MLLLNLNLEQRVIWFISEVTGRKLDKLHLSSRLLHDLGIDGDDAAELVTKYAEAFQVDMKEFEFGKYFRSEPNLVSIFDRKQTLDSMLPLTIRDLVEYALRGHCAGHSH